MIAQALWYDAQNLSSNFKFLKKHDHCTSRLPRKYTVHDGNLLCVSNNKISHVCWF